MTKPKYGHLLVNHHSIDSLGLGFKNLLFFLNCIRPRVLYHVLPTILEEKNLANNDKPFDLIKLHKYWGHTRNLLAY